MEAMVTQVPPEGEHQKSDISLPGSAGDATSPIDRIEVINGNGSGNGHTNGNGSANGHSDTAEGGVIATAGGDETVVTETATPIVATAIEPDASIKFMFRPWFAAPALDMVFNLLEEVDLVALLAGEDPTDKEVGQLPAQLWRKIRRFHGFLEQQGKTTEEVLAFIRDTLRVNLEKLSADQPPVYGFRDAKAIVEATRLYAYGFLFAFPMGPRRELVDRIRANDRGELWFGPVEIVAREIAGRQQAARRDAEYQRAWQAKEEARRKTAQQAAAAVALADEFGELFTAAEVAGIATTSFVRPEVARAIERRLPEPGDVISSRVAEVIIGRNDSGDYVAGIRFNPLAGSEVNPFLPGRYILGVDRQEGETREAHFARTKEAFPAGRSVTLQVVSVEGGDTRRGKAKKSSVLVQIRSAEDLEELRGMRPSFYAPPRKFVVGEKLRGRVVRVTDYGVQVGLEGNSGVLFVHESEIAEGLPMLATGRNVSGRIIKGHGGRDYDFAVDEIIDQVDEIEEARKAARREQQTLIIHPGRVEEVRMYLVESGTELTEDQQMTLKSCCERPIDQPLTEEQVEATHVFFGDILKDADRRFRSVVVSIADYKREQAASEGGGQESVVDTRPLCRYSERSDGGPICSKRVANVGDACDRCRRREKRQAKKEAVILAKPKPKDKKVVAPEDCKRCKPGKSCKEHRPEK